MLFLFILSPPLSLLHTILGSCCSLLKKSKIVSFSYRSKLHLRCKYRNSSGSNSSTNITLHFCLLPMFMLLLFLLPVSYNIDFLHCIAQRKKDSLSLSRTPATGKYKGSQVSRHLRLCYYPNMSTSYLLFKFCVV